MKRLARYVANFSVKKRMPLLSSTPHPPSPLSEAERRQLLVEWNETYAPFPTDLCIHQLFEAQVARTPDTLAVISETQSLTYSQLNERANRLAHYLHTLHIGPDQLVGICLPRSADMLIAVLAVLKAGAAYVPLDPVYPPERLAFMLQDSRAHVLLTHQAQQVLPAETPARVCLDGDDDRQRIAQCPSTNPSSRVQPRHLAYVIYTSGSTGTPKGVAIEHRSLVNHACAFQRFLDLRPTDRLLQFASLSFDTAGEEIFPTLGSGATLLLRPQLSDPLTFLRFASVEAITVLNLPTAYWSALTAAVAESSPPRPRALRTVLVGGERAASKSLRTWQQWAGEQITWINAYGPTETTISATFYIADPHDLASETVPIGRPIANAQMYVLDEALQPTPIGVPGELYIAGHGLARGYLYRQTLTRERFLPCPFGSAPDQRMYMTGDLVRYRSDGQLEFLGRIDQQIKIRGYRIEPGEIAAALSLHPDIQACVITARNDAQEQPQLIAYAIATAHARPTIEKIREFLRQQLPAYMLPSALVCLPAFPLTPNDKVDYAALPAPEPGHFAAARAATPASTPIEKRLVALAAPLLGREEESIDIDENFFLSGGNSLMGIQFVAQIARTSGIALPLRELLEHPTVRSLAQSLEQRILSKIAELDEEEARSLLEGVAGMI
jgi:amino acid adenylation domain-containing protein